MDEQYQNKILFDIKHRFHKKFDVFMVEQWCMNDVSNGIFKEDREEAYRKLYRRIRKLHVANRQTIRRWFGLDGYSVPSRNTIFKLAFALGLTVSETQNYLLYGISQAGFQYNDYQEFIMMYCLEHRLGENQYIKMVDFYEKADTGSGGWEQTSHTNWLENQFDVVKNYSQTDFLVWMCKRQKYFKGYSLNVLNYYHDLVEKCLAYYRDEVKKSLQLELHKVNFFDWLFQQGTTEIYDENDIRRFLKNQLRVQTKSLSQERAREIRDMVAIVYASHDRMCDLVTGVYSIMPKHSKRHKNSAYQVLCNEVKKVDFKYISELLNIAILKERQMKAHMDLAKESDEVKKQQLRKKIKKKDGRIRMVQRADILILTQYIVYKRVIDREENTEYQYDAAEVKKEFVQYADGILEACGMRRLDADYMLDYVLLSCFAEKEIYLFSEVIEEM